MYRTRLSSKGQVVIPAEVRARYGFREGQELVVSVDEDGRLVLEPVTWEEIYRLRGIFRGQRLLEALESERRNEREREDRPR